MEKKKITEVPDFVNLTAYEPVEIPNGRDLVRQRSSGRVDVWVANISELAPVFTIDVSECDLTDGASLPLAILVPGELPDTRFEVGEAIIDGNRAELKLYGEVFGEAVHLIF